jgi:hypothetical protein
VYRATDTVAVALDRVDEPDEEILDAILWHAIKGPDVPMPPHKTAFRIRPLRDDN